MSDVVIDETGVRLPPHDLKIEAGLLGLCMLRPSLIDECIDLVAASDFYSPGHGSVWESICRLHEASSVSDPQLVADDLRRLGQLDNAGGPSALVSMVANAPASITVGDYASRIAEMAGMRRLVKVADGLREAAFSDHDLGPAGLIDLTHTRLDELDMGVGVLPDSFVGNLDEFMDRPAEERRPWVIPGQLREGHRIVFVAEEGMGKALDIGTPVPTPAGWTTMGDIRPGDVVFGEKGEPVRVVAVTETMHDRPCYRLTFSDGETIVADADHRWVTKTLYDRDKGRGGDVRTTLDIARSVRVTAKNAANHSVDCVALDPGDVDLSIDPYLLGAWLGDGTTRTAEITTSDVEVIEAFRADGWTMVKTASPFGWRIRRERPWHPDSFQGRLRALSVLGDKHIPAAYLRGSAEQRLALLAGLMDTDGHITKAGTAELTLMNERLATDAAELIRSLGMKTVVYESDAKIDGRVVGRRWRMTFVPHLPVFRGVPRKVARLRSDRINDRATRRYIVNCEPVPSVPVRCIQVDGGMFLVGRHFTPTHNSVLLRQIALCASQGVNPFAPQKRFEPVRALVIDLENPDDAIDDQMNMVLGPLRQAVSAEEWDSSRLGILREPGGINLRMRRDRAMIDSVLHAFRPDIVVAGPAYKMYELDGDRHETCVHEIQRAWDKWRTRFGFALVLEHHAPMASGDGKGRKIRPSDTMLWLRWPEFGIALTQDKSHGAQENTYKFGRWRGDRVKVDLPIKMMRGRPGELPWVFSWPTGTFNNDPRSAPDGSEEEPF